MFEFSQIKIYNLDVDLGLYNTLRKTYQRFARIDDFFDEKKFVFTICDLGFEYYEVCNV